MSSYYPPYVIYQAAQARVVVLLGLGVLLYCGSWLFIRQKLPQQQKGKVESLLLLSALAGFYSLIYVLMEGVL